MNKIMKISIKYIVYCIVGILAPFILYTLYSIPVHAADSTPSADIKIKLEQFKAEIASKAAKLKSEIDRKLTNRAYIGKVKQKSNTSLTLASSSGPRIITINQDSEFASWVKGKKFSQKILSEEDYIASLGDIDETGVLTAKKIVLLPTDEQHTNPSGLKTYLWGQIVAVSDNLATLKSKEGKNIAVSINSDVNVNQFVILTGNMGKNDIFKASFVYIIPQGGILKSKKIASPSATPKSATPSAKKKAP